MTSIEYTYRDNGNIFEMISKNESGQLDGIQKGYYSNGQLYSEHYYENGLKEGIQKGYYSNGQLKYEEYYENGLKEGIQKRYHLNGQPESEHYYENGQLIWKKEY